MTLFKAFLISIPLCSCGGFVPGLLLFLYQWEAGELSLLRYCPLHLPGNTGTRTTGTGTTGHKPLQNDALNEPDEVMQQTQWVRKRGVEQKPSLPESFGAMFGRRALSVLTTC